MFSIYLFSTTAVGLRSTIFKFGLDGCGDATTAETDSNPRDNFNISAPNWCSAVIVDGVGSGMLKWKHLLKWCLVTHMHAVGRVIQNSTTDSHTRERKREKKLPHFLSSAFFLIKRVVQLNYKHWTMLFYLCVRCLNILFCISLEIL